MAVNIKNAETEQLARELAALTGESVTAAVTTALRERLERLNRASTPGDPAERAARMLALGRDVAARLPEPWRSEDHGKLLYDDKGLPR